MKEKAVARHGGCGNAQPEIRREGLKLWAAWKARKGEDEEDITPERRRIHPQDAINTFRLVTDETLVKMGLNQNYARPEWMILQALPVPPPAVRPSISVDGSGQGSRGEDDLTFKLGDIVRANQAVLRTEVDGTPDHIKIDLCDLLQYHIATYMDNEIAGLDRAQHKSGRPIKSIRARLKGKEGRLRQNLMGKRVDFSARTVITGDPNLALDEVGVPRSIARTLTFPETVTHHSTLIGSNVLSRTDHLNIQVHATSFGTPASGSIFVIINAQATSSCSGVGKLNVTFRMEMLFSSIVNRHCIKSP